MASPILFSTGASPASVASRNLVEFKAGKMEMRDGKMVYPLKKKGMVYLIQSPDDNLMHFCWKDRQTGVVEDDLILFPDDCEFKKVKECTTGRVYVLKMKSSNRKMFFWMQEFRTDRDDDYCRKINEMLNNPPRAGSEMRGGNFPRSSERDLHTLLDNMTQEQVAQLLNSNGVNLASLLNSAAGRSPSSNSGTSASSTASTTNSSAPTSAQSASANSGAATAAAIAAAATSSGRDSNASLNDFRALLSGAFEGNDDALMAILESRQEGNAPTGSSGPAERASAPLIDLSTALNSDSLAQLLNDEAFLRSVEAHLPPVTGESNPSNLRQPLSSEELKKQSAATIRSAQFRRDLSQFSMALQSGQLGPLMSQFGLNQACVDAASLGNLEAFVRALVSQFESSQRSASAGNQPPGGESRDKN